MKLRAYLCALIVGLYVSYPAAAETGFSTEGVVGWITETMVFTALLGFMINQVYERMTKNKGLPKKKQAAAGDPRKSVALEVLTVAFKPIWWWYRIAHRSLRKFIPGVKT